MGGIIWGMGCGGWGWIELASLGEDWFRELGRRREGVLWVAGSEMWE